METTLMTHSTVFRKTETFLVPDLIFMKMIGMDILTISSG